MLPSSRGCEVWWRRTAHVAPPGPVTRDEADEQGLNDAREALDRALSQWPEVTRIAEDIRGIRRRNHLADKVEDAFGGHRR